MANTTLARPNLPSFLRSALSGSRPIQLTFSDVSDTNIASTSSFVYDPPRSPLKSTQQLNVDWTKFENHTFFMSAEAKVNLAFDQIINGYPFDGTRAETEIFFEKISGFDKWVFDSFPKYRGELAFSGAAGVTSEGTSIVIKDAAGSLFPELAKNSSGDSILNPTGKSMTIEMHLFLPEQPNDIQTVFQKVSSSSDLSETQGFGLYLMPSISTSSCEVRFSVVSGSYSITTSTTLDKGAFNHIAVTLNREEGVDHLQFFKTDQFVNVSRSRYVINQMRIDASDFTIGSGSAMNLGSETVTPTETLSGTLDELRVFHSIRTLDQLLQYAKKPVFADAEALKLYLKFNEPPPPLTTDPNDSTNAIVLDSSGNALHALITNFTGSLRIDAGSDPESLFIYEADQVCPVLFPAHSGVIAFNADLLSSATIYDQANPNLITRLIPQHYLLDGAAFEGFKEIEGNRSGSLDGPVPYGGSGIPGQGIKSNVQLMLSFLYIYAKFFDELKLFVDSFGALRYINYNTADTVPDNFIMNLIDQWGFNLPPLFADATLEQYIRGENITPDVTVSTNTLRSVQSELLRRALINLPDVLKSKGTQHSIRSFFRAVGIDPDNSLRIREFGGPTTRQLSFSRETKRETNVMAAMSSSTYVVSPPLVSPRTEPGFPEISGDPANDSLLTSGSWTVEMIVKWTPVRVKAMTSATQSLARLVVSSSTNGLGTTANFLAVSASLDPKLVLYVRPGDDQNSPVGSVALHLPLVNGLFDGDRWNVSFGCIRNDEVGSTVSSSYFIRAAREAEGNVEYFKTTSSFIYELSTGSSNVYREFTAASETGPFLAVGEGDSIPSGSGLLFLNENSSRVDPEARVKAFNGLQSNLRFWSKALTEDEWREHVRNYKSLGVEDPLVNYNFVTTRTGSFGRVRFDSLTKQETRDADGSGNITFLDFTLNGFHLTGSGFPAGEEVLVGELFDYSFLSPYFDEASTNEKIRARSFQTQDLVDATPWAQVAPVYEVPVNEQPTDDVRLAIEFSLVDALNRDIVTMFSTFDALDNALGAPELVFSPDYPDLERLRDVYFNRIHEKLNFKAFFEFYRWFDSSISTFVSQLIPRKTDFKGTNFLIESHMLERHKLAYFGNEMYLADEDRSRIQDVLLLQQIVGSLSKY